MQRYPVRASQRRALTPEALESMARAEFGEVTREGPTVQTRFGAIAGLKVWADAKELCVEVTMDPKVDNAVAADTIGRYNRFLQAATGYSAKERASKLRKAATAAPS